MGNHQRENGSCWRSELLPEELSASPPGLGLSARVSCRPRAPFKGSRSELPCARVSHTHSALSGCLEPGLCSEAGEARSPRRLPPSCFSHRGARGNQPSISPPRGSDLTSATALSIRKALPRPTREPPRPGPAAAGHLAVRLGAVARHRPCELFIN